MSKTVLQGAVTPRANVYFDGRCVSHSLELADGSRKSVGVIMPGSTLTFNTGAPEIMQGVGGSCEWRLQGTESWLSSGEGQEFSIPGNTSFDIRVGAEPYHYICHFG